VQEAWRREQPLTVHGWIYGLTDGLLRDLDVCVSNAAELGACCSAARRCGEKEGS
jgi:carbonic anhydrase